MSIKYNPITKTLDAPSKADSKKLAMKYLSKAKKAINDRDVDDIIFAMEQEVKKGNMLNEDYEWVLENGF